MKNNVSPPTWSAILPMTLEAYKQGIKKLTTCRSTNPAVEEKVRIIEAEFKKMAMAADKWIEYCKEINKPKLN